MSSLLNFNALFAQPNDPAQTSEACEYEHALREAEASLIECSARYGDGSDVKIEPFDTSIPRSTVPRPKKKPAMKRCESSWSDCYSSSASAAVEEEEDDDGDRPDGDRGGEREEDDHLHMHAVRATSAQSQSQQRRGAQSPQPPERAPLVLLHGYANGSSYFYRNLHGLSRHFAAVYSVDMLGWGLSSRPDFVTTDETVASAEDFFVDSLEAWRIANGIDRMVLGGHSLGGYVAVAYAERHPRNVSRLLLLSPVGVQDMPADPVAGSHVPVVHKVVYGVARTFWSNGWTPGAVIRAVPESKGRMGVARYVDNRLPAVTCPQEREALIGYLYNNAVLPPSGEGCLNRLLRPGAYAIDPCVHRIPNLRVGEVVFVYGEKDWMDPTAGLEVERICRERRADGDDTVPDVTVHAVRNAGHLLMIENCEGFNAAVVLACGGVLENDMHRPGSFVDKKATPGRKVPFGRQKTVSTVESEVTEESMQESVEIDMNRRVVVSSE